MAACDIAHQPAPAAAPAHQHNLTSTAFSPLTLFESTITNAQMLVESMGDKELLSALRIIDSLHTHVVHVMEPRYTRAYERLAQLEADAPHIMGSISPASSGPAASYASSPSNKDAAAAGSGSDSGKIDNSDMDDDDDCIITHDFDEDSTHGASLCYPYAKLPRLEYTLEGMVAAQSDVPTECKTIMRRAYKALKGSGPHLFDFSLPFSAEANQRVANLVLDKAKEMAEGKGWPDDIWQNLPRASRLNFIFTDFSLKLRNKHKMFKLSRRQKSFELVSGDLADDELEKFRTILNRDYTSSDEECGDAEQLRVRELAWESDEVKQLKKQLDKVFSDNCATTKQRLQLSKSIRDPLRSRSQRPPPDGAPNWALKAPMRKGSCS